MYWPKTFTRFVVLRPRNFDLSFKNQKKKMSTTAHCSRLLFLVTFSSGDPRKHRKNGSSAEILRLSHQGLLECVVSIQNNRRVPPKIDGVNAPVLLSKLAQRGKEKICYQDLVTKSWWLIYSQTQPGSCPFLIVWVAPKTTFTILIFAQEQTWVQGQ